MNQPFKLFRILIAGCFLFHGAAKHIAAAEPPIRIGFVGDFSSVTQSYTHNAFAAAEMAVEELNARGGVLGRSVELLSRDGAIDPEAHYRHVTELVRDQGVVAIFGGGPSHTVLAASQASREREVPYLVSIGNPQSVVVEQGHPFVFLFSPNHRMESLGFSIFTTLMPWRRYAWIGPDYIWGREVMGFFREYFEAIGAPIEWSAEIWYPLGNTDYRDGIQRIIASSPDALIVATWGEDLRHFILEAEKSDLFGKMAVFGWFSIIPGSDERLLPEGIWKISRAPFNYLADKYPQTRDFVDRFTHRTGTFPLGFTIVCYDSIRAWSEAVAQAGSVNPTTVATALRGMTFVGLRGESHIRAIDGQLNSPVYFGRLTYPSAYPLGVLESIIEIPAEKLWLGEEEVATRRRNATPSSGQ
ncbi:MAG: ABC transporter substrate-binding protein [Gammaproteobacteria bacterium]|nr:ABC transporter substrate-binding protein [Gammaproteobacteria bacterium]MCP5415488.1 ABC transporter substrate-binding protein [Chromatiaceae bacterium]